MRIRPPKCIRLERAVCRAAQSMLTRLDAWTDLPPYGGDRAERRLKEKLRFRHWLAVRRLRKLARMEMEARGLRPTFDRPEALIPMPTQTVISAPESHGQRKMIPRTS